MTKSITLILSLILIAVIVLVANSAAGNFAPEKQAQATAVTLQAEADAARAAMNLKYDALRKEIMTRARAERDRQIEINKAETLRIGELNTLNAEYAAKLAVIQKDITTTNAEYAAKLAVIQKDITTTNALATGLQILITGIAIALVLIAFAGVTYARNRAQTVQVGDTTIILKGDTIFQPENSLAPYMASDDLPRWLKWLYQLDAYRALRRAAPSAARWQQVQESRAALEPHFTAPQVQSPAAILALKQEQTRRIGLLARRMQGKEARQAVSELKSTPAFDEAAFGGLEIGWLPELEAGSQKILKDLAEVS
jgi:hypothetical protein